MGWDSIGEEARMLADRKNAILGISKEQEKAMVMKSMFKW